MALENETSYIFFMCNILIAEESHFVFQAQLIDRTPNEILGITTKNIESW